MQYKQYYNELPPNDAFNNFEVSYGVVGNGMT